MSWPMDGQPRFVEGTAGFSDPVASGVGSFNGIEAYVYDRARCFRPVFRKRFRGTAAAAAAAAELNRDLDPYYEAAA